MKKEHLLLRVFLSVTASWFVMAGQLLADPPEIESFKVDIGTLECGSAGYVFESMGKKEVYNLDTFSNDIEPGPIRGLEIAGFRLDNGVTYAFVPVDLQKIVKQILREQPGHKVTRVIFRSLYVDKTPYFEMNANGKTKVCRITLLMKGGFRVLWSRIDDDTPSKAPKKQAFTHDLRSFSL